MITARFLAYLHRRYAGTLTTSCTPTELIDLYPPRPDWATWLVSAEGNNPDICAAAECAAQQEPRHVVALCGNSESALLRMARRHALDTLLLTLPAPKDGYLATNSTLGFTTLMARAYLALANAPESVPGQFVALLGGSPRDTASVLSRYRTACQPALDRPHLIVLYTPSSSIGAADLESKFAEAALGTIQITDYRNFAHGRHYWLAKHADTTGVLAFVTPDYGTIAAQTLNQIPHEARVASLSLPHSGVNGQLGSLVLALHITGWKADCLNVDPGQPNVPEFGRTLYRLAMVPGTIATAVPPAEAAAIERKAGVAIENLKARGDLDYWRKAYRACLESLRDSEVTAIVFDYDGTLVTRQDRFDPPIDIVTNELIRLLEGGLWIGIATGRGKSVGHDLRRVIPKTLWARVLIGYYNGSQIASLSETGAPGRTPDDAGLVSLTHALQRDPRVTRDADIVHRGRQVSLIPRTAMRRDWLWELVQPFLEAQSNSQLRARRSGHSIDILAPSVNKVLLVRAIAACAGTDEVNVPRIGDRGRWPGNDWELLAHPLGLSVDEVSPDPGSCWHLAGAGIRGIAATLVYCKALRPIQAGGPAHIVDLLGLSNES